MPPVNPADQDAQIKALTIQLLEHKNNVLRRRALRLRIFISLPEAADLLGVNVRTINRWKAKRRLGFPVCQMEHKSRVLVNVKELLRWADEMTQKNNLWSALKRAA